MDSIVMKLENLGGKVIAYRETPLGVPSSDPLCKQVNGTAAALAALDARIGELNDPNKTPLDVIALRAAVHAPFVALQIRMASTAASIDKARTKLAADQDAFYLPAPADNILDLTADIERRAAFAGLEGSEKDVLWQAMAHDQQPALWAALARFDFGATADRARVVYRALAAERDPAAVAAFDVEDERLSWATSTLDQITATVDASTMQLGPADAVAEPERKAA